MQRNLNQAQTISYITILERNEHLRKCLFTLGEVVCSSSPLLLKTESHQSIQVHIYRALNSTAVAKTDNAEGDILRCKIRVQELISVSIGKRSPVSINLQF